MFLVTPGQHDSSILTVGAILITSQLTLIAEETSNAVRVLKINLVYLYIKSLSICFKLTWKNILNDSDLSSELSFEMLLRVLGICAITPLSEFLIIFLSHQGLYQLCLCSLAKNNPHNN